MNEIEKMRIDVLNSVTWKELDDGVLALDIDSTTDHLRSKGYRKQEWISVDERLPEREGYYLTSTIKGVIMIGAFFSYYASSYNPQFKYDVTHWMPLPEAPKMKGCE